MIVTDARVMIAEDSLWLDGLYIRLKRVGQHVPISYISAESTMWMTHVTIQGDGANASTGSAVMTTFGTFYAEGTARNMLNEKQCMFGTELETAEIASTMLQLARHGLGGAKLTTGDVDTMTWT